MKASYASLPGRIRRIFSSLGVSDGSVFKGQAIQSIDGFPTFDVQLPGVLLHLPPSLYFLRSSSAEPASWKLQIVPNQFEVRIPAKLDLEYGAVGTERVARVRHRIPVRIGLLRRGEPVRLRWWQSWKRGTVDGEETAVGSVEWAPERAKSGALNPITVVAVIACLVIVALMIVLCRNQAKEK